MSNVKKRIQDFEMEKSSLLVLIVSLASTIFNYAFQIVSGRFLTLAVYGDLNTLLSLLTVLGIVASVLSNIATTYAAGFHSNEEKPQLRSFYFFLQKVCIVIFVIVLAAGFFLSGYLQNVFKISSKSIVFYTFMVSGLSVFLSVANGTLQGIKKLVSASVSSFFSLAAKSIFSVIFFLLGFEIWGAVNAILLGTLLALCYSVICLNRYWRNCNRTIKTNISKRKLGSYGAQIYITQICASLFTSGDVLLVKYYFSPEDAGLYSSAAMVGKISTYATSVLVFVLLPLVASKVSQGKDPKKDYLKSLGYGCAASIGFILVCKPIFKFLIRPLLGTTYDAAYNLVLPVAVLMVPLALISITIAYQTGKRNLRILNLTLFCGILLSIIASYFFHDTILQMLSVITAIMLAVAAINAIAVLLDKERPDVQAADER